MRQLLSTDVLVVGGGPAGIGAALGAARHGAKTLLIENHGFFGGIASFTRGMCINQMRPWGEPRSAVHELLIGKLDAYGPLASRFAAEGMLQHALFCNVEYLKVAILDALDAVGCTYFVHLRAVDALVEGNRIAGVIVATKRGLMTLRASVVVDATGDSDVAYFAGAETMQDAVTSPMTLCFNVTNVDMQKAVAFSSDRGKMREVADRARATYPLIPDTWSLLPFPSSTCLYINHAGTRVIGPLDGTDPAHLTSAECTSRRQVLQMVHAMREFGPDVLRDIEITATGDQIGVRETRRIKGVYVLTEQDCLSGAAFDDAVAWRSGVLDIGFVRTQAMPAHHVPYRSILPEKLDGLLVGGRCISTDHVASSAGKSMGNCMATGHAAGVAAALAVEKRCLPRELKVQDIQAALRGDGVKLDQVGRAYQYSPGAETHWRAGENWNRTDA